MKKLIKPFLLILVCTLVVFLFSMIYGFFQPYPSELLSKDVTGYRFRAGIILFCKLLFATLATGTATGFSWAFATEADPLKHRSSTFMLPQLKNVLIVVTACTLLYVVAADLIQPTTESRQNAMLQDAANFEEYTTLAEEHYAKQEYVKAYFYASEAYKLNPEDPDAKDFAYRMETKVVSLDDYLEGLQEVEEKEEQGTSLEQALEYLMMAQESFADNDFWNAHYYAVRAEEISPRDDETKKTARELAASAWNMLSSYTEGVSASTEEIYVSKKAAYDYLEKGDILQAYYAFKILSEKYPKDGDIEKYFADAKSRLEASYFYTDETDDMRSLEKFNNVRFTIDNELGGKDVYEIKGITVVGNTGQLIQYLRDMRITKTDKYGRVRNELSVPYAKMTAQNKQVAVTQDDMKAAKTRKTEYVPFMLLESVNKISNIEALHIKPEWIVSDGSVVPSYLLVDMPYDDFTLIRQASVGPELMPLISLFRFVSIADTYGFSAASYRTTLILRLTLPLFVLALLLYMAVIGWGLRLEPDQPFKTRWSLMFPLFAFVTYIAKDLLLYILRLLVFVLCDYNPAWALFETIVAALLTVLLTSIYFMNLQSE